MNLLVKNATGIQAVHGAVWLAVAALSVGEGIAQSETDIATARDCSQIAVQIPDDTSLTREERIALLDKALLESLNNFDPCRDAVAEAQNAAGGGGSSGAGSQGASGQAGAATGAKTVADSAPASGIQGDLPKPSVSNTPETTPGALPEQIPGGTGTVAANDPGKSLLESAEDNGKLPEDIPPAENDDIIAAQLRQAAMAETDPVAKEKLWDEYSSYKKSQGQ